MPKALARIQLADEVITYNGKIYDLPLLAQFAGLPRHLSLPLRGTHSDMRSIRWSDEIWGSSLRSTYSEFFSEWPDVEDTYEGDIHADVLMTFELWKLWRTGRLKDASQSPNTLA